MVLEISLLVMLKSTEGIPPLLFFFIPRREIRSISSRGPIEVSFHLLNFGLERVYWTSKSYRVYRVFFARKCFIPRREMRSISSRGPIVFTYVVFWDS